MPKEIIYRNGRDPNPNEPTGFVQVGWARDRDVQIGSVQPGGQVSFRNPETGGYESMVSGEPGFFIDLDREGINRLIRSLRKARDQAFGADA